MMDHSEKLFKQQFDQFRATQEDNFQMLTKILESQKAAAISQQMNNSTASFNPGQPQSALNKAESQANQTPQADPSLLQPNAMPSLSQSVDNRSHQALPQLPQYYTNQQ